MRNLNFWSKIFILNFWSSQFLKLPRPCNKSRGQKKIKSKSFHQYSWNSEVETTWISLIDWHHKTSNILCPLDLCGHPVVCDSFQLGSKHHFINQFEDLFIGLDIRNRFFRLAAYRAAPWIDWMPTVKESTFRKQEIVLWTANLFAVYILYHLFPF